MKLSIITINYNNKTGLEKTMQSVLQQTTSDFEYILIDGASTDGSREVIEQYVANPDHSKKITYWVSEKDTGIYNAMNKGIRQAKGEFFLFLNSGDWLVENATLENVLPQIDGTADVYYGDCLKENNNQIEKIDAPKKITFLFLYQTTICHQGCFIKKSLIQEKFYDENLKIVSDWKFFFLLSIENKIFTYINILIANIDTTGISSNNRQLLADERKCVLDEILPQGIFFAFENIINDPLSDWTHYGRLLYNHKIIFKLALFLIKVLNKCTFKKNDKET